MSGCLSGTIAAAVDGALESRFVMTQGADAHVSAAEQVQAIMASGGFAPGPGSNVWGSLLAAAGKAGQGASVSA